MSVYKRGFDLYLDGNISEATQALLPYKANYGAIPVIDDRGVLTSWGCELLCAEYKLDKVFNTSLASVVANSIEGVAPEIRTQFQRCGLIDTEHKVTRNGYYKLIESLPLNEQVARLGIFHEELAFPKEDKKKVENYVVDYFEQRAFRCFADEGQIFSLLISLSLINELDRLNKYSKFDLKHPPATCGVNLRTFWNDFASFPFCATDDRKIAILEIIGQTTKERICSGIEMLQRAGSRQLRYYDVNAILEFFESLGLDRLLKITSFLLDNPDCDTGWPDITAFKYGEVVLIEVKQNDKLRFSQARTISELVSKLGAILPKVQVCKVRLT